MIKKILPLFLLFICFHRLEAQVDSVEVNYSDPKMYELAGIEVVGAEDQYDPATILQQSGLRVGRIIRIPGDEITNAIKKLFATGMFSNVVITVNRIEGDKIYLDLHIQGLPRLSKINFIGLKKSEETKIREKTEMFRGTQVSDNKIRILKIQVERYLKDKGFYNLSVNTIQRDDPEQKNNVILDVIIEKNNKIKISEIVIRGNSEVKDRKLKGAMKKTKERSIINIFKSANYIQKNFEEDRYNLINKYNEIGYRDAVILSDSVVSISPKRVKIYIDVQEGNKYYFNDISWAGNTMYNSEVLSNILGIKKGDVYNSKLLEERLLKDDDAVMNIYQNNGYLFSRMDPLEIIHGNDSINLEIRVIEGPKAVINRVKLKGNTTTHEHVVRRELYTYPGEYWSREDVMRSLRELATLGYFDPEKLDVDPRSNPEDGTVDITYKVEEKSNDKFELSGGWGAGMIIGSVGLTFSNFSIRNIFNRSAYYPLPKGDGQTLTLNAQTNGKYYSQFSLSFMEPWLGGRRPNAFSASIYFSRQTGYSSAYNNSYMVKPSQTTTSNQLMLTYGVNVGLGRRLKWPDNYFQMNTTMSFQRYELKNWAYYIISNGNSNTLSLSTTIRRSSIFNPIFPKSGSDFSLAVTLTPPYSLFSTRDMETEKDRIKYRWIEYHKWKFVGKVYVPLTSGPVDDIKRPLVLYTGIQYGYLGSYNKFRQSPFEGFEMGGDGMSGMSTYGREYIGLRGYENGALTNAGSSFIAPKSSDARLYSKFTMELRYPIMLGGSNTIYALAFLEAGNSWYALKDFEPFNLYRSAGVGVRIWLSMFGILGIDWGYGFDAVPTRPGASKGQFHFVLGQEF
ncbi:MAG: outer membrane protein assembly factor BamA [Odoribacteraceae bacterium]|jgi:outer membrane protein insertion porin family|nr:outer membrane protein assembly factor BamA [Odoribacteraceae bacterium]